MTGIINPIFDILVCYYYTPFHQCVCDILSNFITLFFIRNQFIILYLIIGIINLFFSCVSSEIIILQFCDLDKNTKKNISERGKNIAISDLTISLVE